MTTNTNREAAIARIMAVAQQIADRDAAAAQAVIEKKKAKNAWQKEWQKANPEKHREARRKSVLKRDERRRQRAATDPVYAEQLRQKNRQWYLKRKERLGADELNQKAKESIARVKANDPDGWKQRQKAYQRESRERQKARMASDPDYAKKVRAKRQANKKERTQRQAAELRQLRALQASLQKAAAVKHWLTTEPSGDSGEMTSNSHNLEGTL